MSDTKYKVELLSPEQTALILTSLRPGGPENMNHRRTLILSDGLEMKGEFSLIARDAETNQVEWEHTQENLITDFGRRAWMESKFSSFRVGFCPSRESPLASRISLSTDATQSFSGSGLSPTNNTITHTKTVSTTFSTPATNRTLGTIFIASSVLGVNANLGPTGIWAYSLLTPPKVQTTTQTLEVVYKITLNPIY